jgi:DNA-binding transcriptional MerR regulator
MLRIGEVAKQYNISKRTLRYWEDMGILISSRTDNDYRFYDDESVARIGQIVLLRKLRMPIADIERVFLSGDPDVAIDALIRHLEALKREAADADTLAQMVENLIECIRKLRDLSQVFTLLERRNADLEENVSALKITLSERIFAMSEQKLTNVRIVKLPAMIVASYRAESPSPEGDCGKITIPFIRDNNLHKREGFRIFGFHPLDGRAENNRAYNYEQWVTVPTDFNVPEPFIKKQFEGGLFASVVTQMNEYGERWQALKEWSKNNDKYDDDVKEHSRQWFEEFIDWEAFVLNDEIPFGEKQLDLLLPIRMR